MADEPEQPLQLIKGAGGEGCAVNSPPLPALVAKVPSSQTPVSASISAKYNYG